jgi:hypothetical protein
MFELSLTQKKDIKNCCWKVFIRRLITSKLNIKIWRNCLVVIYYFDFCFAWWWEVDQLIVNYGTTTTWLIEELTYELVQSSWKKQEIWPLKKHLTLIIWIDPNLELKINYFSSDKGYCIPTSLVLSDLKLSSKILIFSSLILHFVKY